MWNERYQADDYVFGTEPNAFVRAIAERLVPSGKTLAIAEGEGRNAVFLAKQGHQVTTWDYAEAGLVKCRRLAAQHQVEVQTQCVDLQVVDWAQEQGRWDQVVCVFGHFPPDLRKKTLQGVKQAIRPGGYYISEVYSTSQLAYGTGGPKDVALLYRAQDLLDAFTDWHIIHFFVGEVYREEGTGHHGLSHVMQLLAQRKAME
jgi:cyclopropane fatty-acyl-phospholipid synthase-like methyltransferase